MVKIKGPRGKYIYCIIKSKKPENFGKIGINGNEVYSINYKDLAAIVSDTSNGSHEILKHGLVHQKVVESVMKKFTLIPMSFGQVPKTKEDVKGFLSEHYLELKEMLEKFDGKIELGLKLSWKMEKKLENIVESSDRIRILNKQVMANPEKSYALKIELGKLVADAVSREEKKIFNEIYKSVDNLFVDMKKNEPIGENMILNAVFLVEKKKEKEFDEKINEAEKEFGDRATFKYVISPPYNFVSIRRK